jgi:hypothetical protein
VVLTGFGGTLALGGGLLLSFAALLRSTEPARTSSDTSIGVVGGVTLAMGAGMLVGGILLVSKGITRVELVKPTSGRPGVYFANGALRF